MITSEVEQYLDAFNGRPTDVTDMDTNEFQRIVTADIETFCSAIVKIDEWERDSKSFRIATRLHINSLRDTSSRFPLSEKYQSYFKRGSDENDFVHKRIIELGNIRDEKRD
jgi:hypothetical protein